MGAHTPDSLAEGEPRKGCSTNICLHYEVDAVVLGWPLRTRALAKIRLLVGTTGGTATGDEDTVVREVRDRLKLLGDDCDLMRVRRTLDYAANPLVVYMQKVFPTGDLAAKTKVERAELFVELLKQVRSHTEHIARLALVVDDDGEWNAFEDRLELQFQGTAPARPASATPPVVASATRTTVPPPWWSRKWFYVGVAFAAVIRCLCWLTLRDGARQGDGGV